MQSTIKKCDDQIVEKLISRINVEKDNEKYITVMLGKQYTCSGGLELK